MSQHRERQQTVKQALDAQSGNLVEASSLYAMSEEQFTLMRRRAMEARVSRRRNGTNEAALVCACCQHPVYLSRHFKQDGNRWFVHDGHAPADCVYHEARRHSEAITRALIYRGQQESQEHRSMKAFIADWLRRDPEVTSVDIEKTKFSAVAEGEWRRPDVRCFFRGVPVVFEIQLSYTFLSTVIERDEFYRREGDFIVWVFQSFDRSRATVTDEAFFNKRNLFVLDTNAMTATLDSGVLMFSGYHQEPRLIHDRVEDVWVNKLVGLRDVLFPEDTRRAYYFDYPAKRKIADEQLRAKEREKQSMHWRQLADSYLAAAFDYYESGHDPDWVDRLFEITYEMEECPEWHRGFSVLRDPVFYGDRGILSVLMSMKRDRPLSYRLPTVFQVIEAGVRKSGHGLQHPYAILYLRGYRVWKPQVKDSQHKWLVNLGKTIRASVEGGESDYLRCVTYDEAIGLLFPDLDDELCEQFGAVHLAHTETGHIATRIAHYESQHPK